MYSCHRQLSQLMDHRIPYVHPKHANTPLYNISQTIPDQTVTLIMLRSRGQQQALESFLEKQWDCSI